MVELDLRGEVAALVLKLLVIFLVFQFVRLDELFDAQKCSVRPRSVDKSMMSALTVVDSTSPVWEEVAVVDAMSFVETMVTQPLLLDKLVTLLETQHLKLGALPDAMSWFFAVDTWDIWSVR